MTEEKLKNIRDEIIDIVRDSDILFDSHIRQHLTNKPDLLSVICSLYNLLHTEVTGEEYEYFFHWANKCGGWVTDEYFDDQGKIKRIDE